MNRCAQDQACMQGKLARLYAESPLSAIQLSFTCAMTLKAQAGWRLMLGERACTLLLLMAKPGMLQLPAFLLPDLIRSSQCCCQQSIMHSSQLAVCSTYTAAVTAKRQPNLLQPEQKSCCWCRVAIDCYISRPS